MTDLIAIRFPNADRAEQALAKAREAQQEHLVDLANAVIVTRAADGTVSLRQSVNTAAIGAASGGMWGTLIGLVFLNPLLGLAAGAAAGALSGYMTDFGINDDMMKRMGQKLEPGSSALFVLVRKATPDRILPELRALGGELFHSSLSEAEEARLREALAGEAARRMEAGEPLADRPDAA